MRNADEVPVHHLVADSGAFIKRAPLQDLGAIIYTISDVIDELKCEKSKHLLETIPYEITIREPSKQSLRIVSECSKKTGDYSALSAVDLKILALTHDLHVQVCGADKLNYECKKVPSKETNPENGADKDDNDKNKADKDKDNDDKEPEVVKKYDSLAGFYNPPPKEQKNNTEDDRPKSTDNGVNDNDNADDGGSDNGSDNESDESSDNEGWLDERNIDENLLEMGAVAVPDKDMKVACITTDFAIQNVLLHIGLALLSVDGYRIRRLNSYILRCRSCFATTSQMDRRFCAKCGNDSLHRVAVTVDDDGTMLMHINWQRLTSKRGLQYSLPAPKGGKHATDPQLFEDQRIPQNRTAKSRIDPLQRSPFTMHDVTSRSAMLGIRDGGGHVGVKRNPNAPARGRKRGGKRR